MTEAQRHEPSAEELFYAGVRGLQRRNCFYIVRSFQRNNPELQIIKHTLFDPSRAEMNPSVGLIEPFGEWHDTDPILTGRWGKIPAEESIAREVTFTTLGDSKDSVVLWTCRNRKRRQVGRNKDGSSIKESIGERLIALQSVRDAQHGRILFEEQLRNLGLLPNESV